MEASVKARPFGIHVWMLFPILLVATVACAWIAGTEIAPPYRWIFWGAPYLDRARAAQMLQCAGAILIATCFMSAAIRSAPEELLRALLYLVWWNILWKFQFVHGDYYAYVRGAGAMASGGNPWDATRRKHRRFW